MGQILPLQCWDVGGGGRTQSGRQVGCAGLHGATHPTKVHPPPAPSTWRSSIGSPELPIGAKPQGNAHFPGEPLTACSHQAGQSSMGMGSPWKSKHTLASGNPSWDSPGVPGSLFCRSQSGIWPIFPIFNPRSSSWKPSKLFFCLSQV